ncbi:hypothetical protein G3I59_45350 [Amycolatopsis rubida]|uniref:Uncharacterized protein n=1 Tax=Amycolatopsis rubida TaxID=112413 RepID=A0ABX0C7G6_9PSEU|nr:MULTISPECIES: hypothetical protein [Amycolatopsis]MYW97652.1 hypothetical protein [Amycolatopsis rubida]NEC62637.1 hypothetical protein [Amycolatopsis rubida]
MAAVEAPLEVLEPGGHPGARLGLEGASEGQEPCRLNDRRLPRLRWRRELERYFEYLRQRPNFGIGESLPHSCIAKQYRRLQQFCRCLDEVE